MIKVVSFDIGGTLLENDNISNQSGYGLKELTNLVKLPYESVRIAYKEVFQKTKGNLKELVSDFCNKLQLKVSSELIDFFNHKFSETSEKNFISPEKILLINDLKKSGYKVILFSNSCCLLNNEAINKIITLVDNIFYSYDIGYTKDDEKSYQYIEKIMKAKPNEILHIGDTVKSDYYMPLKNGWNALYYGNCNDESVNSIISLMDLYKILDFHSKINV